MCAALDEGIRAIKATALKNLCSTDLSMYKEQDENKIRDILLAAFQRRSSTAVVVTGPSGQRNMNFIRKVLNRFRGSDDSRIDYSVATIKGLMYGDDRDALLQLAEGLGFVTSGRNFDANSDALQEFLKHGRLAQRPTVLILESFEEFARNSRQVLLYTLLDLLHRPDLLLVILGTTCCADVSFQLEKRIVSRLSAQFLEISSPSPAEICQELLCRLKVDRHQCVISEQNREFIERFIADYNTSVEDMFGHISQPGCIRGVKRPRAQEAEEILSVIEKWSMWGRELSFFILAAKKLILGLSSDCAVINSRLFLECIAEMCPDPIIETLSNLTKIELWLFAICVRIYFITRNIAASGSSRGQQTKVAKAPEQKIISFSVSAVSAAFEKLVKLSGKNGILQRDLFAALATLHNLKLISVHNGTAVGARSAAVPIVHSDSAILLGISPLDAKLAFENRSLKMPDKVRRAVLEPLEPLLEEFSGGRSLLSMDI